MIPTEAMYEQEGQLNGREAAWVDTEYEYGLVYVRATP